MLTDTGAVRGYFAKLGLEPEIADIYLALHANGPQNMSQLARSSGVERTRLYRLVDALMDSNLIELEANAKRGIIKAAPIANLRILISQKEQELRALTEELELIEQVLARNSISNAATRVHLYRGPEGIRQMLSNELEATSEILSYSNQILSEITGSKFMEAWSKTFEAKALQARLLISDDFLQSWKAHQAASDNTHVAGMTYHHISTDHLSIQHICDIYDNTVAYVQHKDCEVYGLAIYSADIANAQRQLFELAWNRSTSQDLPATQ